MRPFPLHRKLGVERRRRWRGNPWVSALLIILGIVGGWQTRLHLLDWRMATDNALAPELLQGDRLLICKIGPCLEQQERRLWLIGTPVGELFRAPGAAPGEEIELRPWLGEPPSASETTRLRLPAQGDTCQPALWSPIVFDALMPLLRSELRHKATNPAATDSLLQVDHLFLADGRIMQPGELPWSPISGRGGDFLDRGEMERRTRMVASHRLGSQITWRRDILWEGEPLETHVWSTNALLALPRSRGWSWWIIPQDSLKGVEYLSYDPPPPPHRVAAPLRGMSLLPGGDPCTNI